MESVFPLMASSQGQNDRRYLEQVKLRMETTSLQMSAVLMVDAPRVVIVRCVASGNQRLASLHECCAL